MVRVVYGLMSVRMNASRAGKGEDSLTLDDIMPFSGKSRESQ